jgi:fluoroquinolone transport system permease protein
MRWVTAAWFDVRFQWRHGFYYAYLLVCVLYVVLLRFVQEGIRDEVAVLLTFSDPSALGLIFAGGILLLERGQGIHDALFVTPVRLGEYVWAKMVSLGVLSLAAAWAIHLPTVGVPEGALFFSIGVVLTSWFFTLLGLGVAVKYRSINGFIIASQVYSIVFTVPLLGYLRWWDSGLYRWLPTHGSLLLLNASYRAGAWEAMFATFVLGGWVALAFLWARRELERAIVLRKGGGV